MEVEIDGAAIYRREVEIGVTLLQNKPLFSEEMYSICLKPYTGLGLPSCTRQQQQKQLEYQNFFLHLCVYASK